MNDSPKLSVIIPTRDRSDIIGGCLDRLLIETGPLFETIVVDSSSTENTQKILSRYPRVINHRLGNITNSMVLARNVGISTARGEIIAFLDDDCYIRPGWLRELSNAFDDQEVVAAGGRIIYHPWKLCNYGEPIALVDLEKDIVWGEWDRLADTCLNVPTLPGGNCAVRRDAALAAGGFDTNFIGSANLEETDFFLRVSKLGGRFVFVPTAVVEHRAAPRTDKINRSNTNFIYRYSMVRNRLYLLRKHQSLGLIISLRRQLIDVMVGTSKIFFDGLIFASASISGIVTGLLANTDGDSKGLSDS